MRKTVFLVVNLVNVKNFAALFNLFMPIGIFYYNSLDRSISYRKPGMFVYFCYCQSFIEFLHLKKTA